MKKALLLIACLSILSACSSDRSYLDGKIVKDSEGTIYQLEHRAGAVFWVIPIDTMKVNEIIKIKSL